MKVFFVSLVGLFIVGYTVLAGYLFVNQRRFIYFPQKMAVVQEQGAQPFLLERDGLSLRGWVVNPGFDQALIYFGGNAEDVAASLGLFKHTFSQRSVYLLNYRGYGDSEGVPSEALLYADALAFYDRVAARHVQVDVLGRSLGSGVASYVAANRAVRKLILVTPFDSVQSMAQKAYPYFPMRFLLRDKFDSLARASHIKARTLMIIAEKDEIIARAHSDRLAAGFDPAQIDIKVLPGATHNSLSTLPAYRAYLHAFL